MSKLQLILVSLLLSAPSSQAVAQPLEPVHWVNVGSDVAHPVAEGTGFDLAFGPDQLPVLVDRGSHGIALKRWTGTAWTNLAGIQFVDAFPRQVRAASNWAGNIIVGVRLAEPFGFSIQVFELRDTALVLLGSPHPVPSSPFEFAMAIDARGPVVAWAAAGSVVVKRWNGATWVQLGSVVNEPAIAFRDPALGVTGDGRLVVAYTRPEGGATRVEAKAWNGSGWTQFGSGLPTPSRSTSLAGMDSGAPVAAYLGGGGSQVSLWNGSSWNPASHPCPPPAAGSTLAPPSLTVVGNQMRVLCAIGDTANRRTLVARVFTPFFGWSQLGGASINGPIRLAGPLHLAYVARTAPGGKLWAAWAADSQNGSAIIVSTLVPNSLGPTQ